MAIIYTVPDTTPFIFGGQLEFVEGLEIGLPGPMPRYSISREAVFKDTLYIANKYIITITGTAIINEAASMLVAGERHQKILKLMRMGLFQESKQGLLEISTYGGLTEQTMRFTDAVFTGIDMDEQDDTSQGVQSQSYTVTFEAYHLTIGPEADPADPESPENNIDSTIETTAKNGLTEEQNGGEPVVPTVYNLIDTSETWDYQVAEENVQVAYGLDPYDAEKTESLDEVDQSQFIKVYRTYTITQTISAKGRPRTIVEEDGLGGEETRVESGYIEAFKYVNSRLKDLGDDPLDPVKTLDRSRNKPQPLRFRFDLEGNDFNPDLPEEGKLPGPTPFEPEPADQTVWNSYNLVQTHKKDILAGTYEVTRTWTIAPFKAGSTIEFEYNTDPTNEYNTVTVNINITGYECQETYTDTDGNTVIENADKRYTNKYQQAKKHMREWFPTTRLYDLANTFYKERQWSALNEPAINPVRDTSRPPLAPLPTDPPELDLANWVDITPEDSIFLRPHPSSFSQTHNQTSGTISLSVSFDDNKVPSAEWQPGVLSESVSISSTNEDGLDQAVAILAVIAKPDGPVIQNMSTTRERRRSITLNWLMDFRLIDPADPTKGTYRDKIPEGAVYVDAYFKPQLLLEGGTAPDEDLMKKVYRDSMTETWNHKTGEYSISVDYVWTETYPSRRFPTPFEWLPEAPNP
jgi:hypothetical protein